MNQLTQKIERLKITPFKGGLNNNNHITKKEDESLELEQIFRNKTNIQTISNFLVNYKLGAENKYKGIIIRGNIGCGKITLIKACLKRNNYTYLLYDTDYESDDIFDNLLLSVEAKGITKLLNLKGTHKKAIIIRDIDNALRPTQKLDFYKFISKSKCSLPIILTSNDKTIGTIREVPKCILQIDFENPYLIDLVKFFENDNISKNALEKIISDSKFDFRYINNVIKGFENTTKKINIKKAANFSKDLELDTFECIKYCSDPKHNLDEKLLYSNLYTNSTVFHNYLTIINNDIETCANVAEYCRISEELTNFAFENQDWISTEEMYCYMGTIAPLELMYKKGHTIDVLTYPSNSIIYYKENCGKFSKLEQDSILIKIIIDKYFVNNKFVGKLEDFQKEIKVIDDPIKAYKLGHMLNDPKKSSSFLKEFKKKLCKPEE